MQAESVRRWCSAGVLVAALCLSACATTRTPPPIQDYATREAVLETALGQIGRPYRYGGGDGNGFDCSGLVQFVYAQSGVELPRTAAQQRDIGMRIPLAYAAPGDLVFFDIGGGDHVGIYVGDGRVVHAPASGQTVTVTSINSAYWRDHFAEAVRILR